MPSMDLRYSLNDKEKRVLSGIIRGESIQQISNQMGLTIESVRDIRSDLFVRLSAGCSADLVRIGLMAGLS